MTNKDLENNEQVIDASDQDANDDSTTHINTDLNTKIEELQLQVKNAEAGLLRALADYKNFQNRVEEERTEIIKYATQPLLQRLLFIADSLEMLENHLNDQGLTLIIKEFKQILNDEGVEEIKSDDKEYDVHTMEAIEMVEGEENKVIETTQKGYMCKDKVLRTAKVKVGKGK